MTEQEAWKLGPGDRVIWQNDPADAGTVVLGSGDCFAVDWDNGMHGWIDCRDAEKISRAPGSLQ